MRRSKFVPYRPRDFLGNWEDQTLDTGGDGLSVNTTVTSRTHSDSNEILTEGAGSFTHDVNGNTATSVGPAYDYVYDAWNRLVEVKSGANTVGEYAYNGLHHRIRKRANTDTTPGVDEERLFYYTPSWQVLEERVGGALITDPFDLTLRHIQNIWGLEYLNCIVERRVNTDLTDDSPDVTYDEQYFPLADVQYSIVAIVDDAGALVERVSYDAYGEPRHHWIGDVDGDGDQDTTDRSAIFALVSTPAIGIGNASYNVDADLDRNGVIDMTDYNLSVNTSSALKGDISDVDNTVGFHGHYFNPETGFYQMRYREYSPTFGRFLQRDPAGYVDGMSLYEFVRANPISRVDPVGLLSGADVDVWIADIHLTAADQMMRLTELHAANRITTAELVRDMQRIGVDAMSESQALANRWRRPAFVNAPESTSPWQAFLKAYTEASYGAVGTFTGGLFDKEYGYLGYKDEVLYSMGLDESREYDAGVWAGRAAEAALLAAGAVVAAEAAFTGGRPLLSMNLCSEGNVFRLLVRGPGGRGWGFRIDPAHHGKPWGHMHFWRWIK